MGSSERFRGANIVNAGAVSPYWGEHVARYKFALPFVKGVVLDIACGTGYGIALLKDNADYIVGVDIDADAIEESKKECSDNAKVLFGNGLELPFADNTFDTITSFETLEHLHERKLFLSELKRVLRPKGKLILSTPNAFYTKPINGKPSNPYHIFEYTPEELKEELSPLFEIEEFLGQSIDPSIKISPFYSDQVNLPKDLKTQSLLYGWKVFNRLPINLRERLSSLIWKKPFYPTEKDYFFEKDKLVTAHVLYSVCINNK